MEDYVDLDATLFEDGAAAGVITIKVNTESHKFVISYLAASTGRPANLSQVGELEWYPEKRENLPQANQLSCLIVC